MVGAKATPANPDTVTNASRAKVQAAPVQARKLDLRVPKTPPEPGPEDEPVPSHFKRPTAHYGMSGMVPVKRPYVFCLHIILGSV